MQKNFLLIGLALSFFSATTFADNTSSAQNDSPQKPSPYGINFSYSAIGQSPKGVHGYRASFLYEPPNWVWHHVHIFLDTSYGHWWVTGNKPYSSLNIYSIAPVLRYYFKDYEWFVPFIDLSIGPSYLTKTHLDDHNLGIHYAFQDQVGVGASFGSQKKLTASVSALHYSNGSMSHMNAGINIPMMLNISYRF